MIIGCGGTLGKGHLILTSPSNYLLKLKGRIEKRKRIWRVSILILLVVSFMGPWIFEVIWVPLTSEYSCSDPFIRLDGYLCGMPMSGIWLYRNINGFIYAATELATGTMRFADWIREFLFSLILFLPILPLFTTTILIMRGDHRRRQIFNISAWGLGVVLGLLMGLSNYPKLFYVLWGVWLYTLLAISMFILEILALNAKSTDS